MPKTPGGTCWAVAPEVFNQSPSRHGLDHGMKRRPAWEVRLKEEQSAGAQLGRQGLLLAPSRVEQLDAL